ncbi:UNVERIFIED_CONTAM: Retrovirus-related Pol polyprotein from transposon TNT 1-94 [Sesamum radiatum]|uniref:Retrovirus-related Pol polyprotein from transposon TNT 1-94 n=1 Tax=Sesamum radiatum TaxID=300843 RepID=A0AAW2VMB5_SESRA
MGDSRRRGYSARRQLHFVIAEKGKLENKKAKDSEALYYIQTAVADHIFPRISVATSAKEAWSILQKEYQGSAKNSNRKEENSKSTMVTRRSRVEENTCHVVFAKEQIILRRIATSAGNHNVEIARSFGHVEKDCRLKGNHLANCIKENHSSDQLFYTCNSVAETGDATWYIDSAASNHMTYNKGAFQKLDESFKTNVKLGDNHIVKVEGKGSVAINTRKGTRIINDVMYIPNLRTNLFSVGQMMEKVTLYNSEEIRALFMTTKIKLLSLQKNLWRAKAVLELIHTDVCGPMRTPSHEQNRYFILFIDDYSRMTWVYFMREKSEVFKIFKKFKNLVEKQSGQRIKVLRSDRGKEYNNSEFDKFCEEEGIDHQTTVSYNPQQNGVSERKNRTVMEMARSMLQEKHLPKAFWAEAVYTAVYLLLNRCPTKAVQNMTPIEAWSGRKPSAKHLRVFGSICYVHIPTEKRHKLEEKQKKESS